MDEPSTREDPFKGKDPFAATNGDAADPFKEEDPFKSAAPADDPFKGSKWNTILFPQRLNTCKIEAVTEKSG